MKIRNEIKNVLVEKRFQISKLMRPDEVAELMFRSGLLSKADLMTINRKPTKFLRSATFLSIISRKKICCYLGFIKTLHATKQHCLVSLLQTSSKHLNLPSPIVNPVEETKYCGEDTGDGSRKFVEISSPEFYHQTKHESYDILSDPQSHALFVTILAHGRHLAESEARNVDNLIALLSQIGYDCATKKMANVEEALNEIQKFAENLPSSASCIIGCFSYDVKEFSNSIKDKVVSIFDNCRCPALQNKPKLFLFSLSEWKSPSQISHSFTHGRVVTCDDAVISTKTKQLPTSSDTVVIHLVLTGKQHRSLIEIEQNYF